MITKERLEEFIQNKTVIYNIAKGQNGTRWLRTLDVNDITDIEEKFIYYVPDEYPEIANFSDLFETKEDAEFALRFQNIPRIEELNLPTYQEVKNEIVYEQYFYNSIGYHFRFEIANYGAYPKIIVTCVNDYRYKYKSFEKKFTKTNFYKACELCRKLFLGEVEE